MKRWLSLATLSLLLTGAAREAEAHLVNTRLGDFYGGALHSLDGFDYVLPWLALVILAAFQGPQRGRWLFLVFPFGLLAGAELSLLLPKLAFVPLFNVALIASVGLLAAFAATLPLPVFIALSAVVALVQGYENGQAIGFDTDRILFIGGVTMVGYVFVALTMGMALSFLNGRGAWRPIALRAGGSWIAAVGIMVLGFELMKGSVTG